MIFIFDMPIKEIYKRKYYKNRSRLDNNIVEIL